MKITRLDEYGQELKPGSRHTHQHNLTTPKFTIITVLEEMDPDRWRAEVKIFDETIIDVHDSYPSSHEAGVAAEAALRKRLVELFGTSA